MVKGRQVAVSIPRWLYERIKNHYQANKEELARWGVNSVNGLISAWLTEAIEAVEGRYQPGREAVKAFPPRGTAVDDSVTKRPTASEKSL